MFFAKWSGDTTGFYGLSSKKWYLKIAQTGGQGDLISFKFGGDSSWKAVGGDWNNDGRNSAGLYKPANSKWYLPTSRTDGPADLIFQFGPTQSTWIPLAGLWD